MNSGNKYVDQNIGSHFRSIFPDPYASSSCVMIFVTPTIMHSFRNHAASQTSWLSSPSFGLDPSDERRTIHIAPYVSEYFHFVFEP